MSNDDLDLEQSIRKFYFEMSTKGMARDQCRTRAQSLLEQIQTARKTRNLSGYEASKLPWLQNLAK